MSCLWPCEKFVPPTEICVSKEIDVLRSWTVLLEAESPGWIGVSSTDAAGDGGREAEAEPSRDMPCDGDGLGLIR